ncbi:HAD family phosphatase [Oscillatoria sp. CS-180]|uniref:HAD family hydrolase n=1 Tax=Oscillatoria sp. CS-180 TaxID=3021720 RepID=UPI00232ABC73|nr:HAD family phosphatase [Oscillatoria sp. CS-180]MDB9529168.1 HAD family phosphatase [Oscillatoria sp. CS-180]
MITHIVLDMGGVLVQLEWAERISSLLGRSVPIDELHHLWINAQSTVDFESGRTDFDEFAIAFIEEFGLSVAPEKVQQEFLEFVQAPMAHCNEVLALLKQNYHLSLLSNTNPAHYERLRDRYDFFRYFDSLFLSYKLGKMKPDAAIFQYVLAELETASETVAFFDDGARNVETACQLGIQGYQVTSPNDVMTVVKSWNTAQDEQSLLIEKS